MYRIHGQGRDKNQCVYRAAVMGLDSALLVATMTVVAVAEPVDGVDDRGSNVCQLGVIAAATAALPVAGERAYCMSAEV